jgi:hypothetical protein
MSGFDAKALKKIAAACRAAGIKHYKCPDFEFTLSDDVPESNYKRNKRLSTPFIGGPAVDPDFKTDGLTEDALMMWSAVDPLSGEASEEDAN